MRTVRPTTLVIQFLVALLFVLLIGFLPLRDLLYPQPVVEVASPTAPTLAPALAPSIEPPSTAVIEAPVEIEPAIEVHEPLWIANHADGSLLRVDANTSEITGRVDLEGSIDALTWGEGGVWAALTTPRGQSQIVRIDPVELTIAAVIPIYSGRVRCLQAGAGAVWVGIEQAPAESLGGSLIRIDTSADEITAVIPRPGIPIEIDVYAQSVWFLEYSQQGTAPVRLDSVSLQAALFDEHAPGEPAPSRYDHLALGPAGVWAAAAHAGASFLYQLDPSDGRVLAVVDTGEDDGVPTALEAGGQDILVWLSNGVLLRVDPILQQVVSRLELSPGAGRIHARPGVVWVENESQAELYRIEAGAPGVAVTVSTGSRPQPTPSPTLTLAPDEPVECSSRYPTRLEKGGVAVVSEEPPVPNRLRSLPDVKAPVLGQIEPGEKVNLLDGPVCSSGWVWWYVQSRSTGEAGWTSEGDRHEYWLAPVE